MKWFIKKADIDMTNIIQEVLLKLPGSKAHGPDIISFQEYFIHIRFDLNYIILEFTLPGSSYPPESPEPIHFHAEDETDTQELVDKITRSITRFVEKKHTSK